MRRRGSRIVAGIMVRLFLCWLALNLQDLWASDPPVQPPSFWDGSMVVGVGRPGWVYYHVTNLPRNSVLYCPNYPELPDAYPDWPRKRLERPIVEEEDGQIFLRDPQVERAKELEKAEHARSKESLWARLWRVMDVPWKNLCLRSKPNKPKNYLFLPKLDNSFTSSTIFRYLPPDQFWQVCSQDVILVEQGEPENIKRRLISEGCATHKIVVMVGETPYSKTIHTVDFWQPWSLFCQGLGSAENKKMAEKEIGIQKMRDDIVKTAVEPGEAGEQVMRKWRILRQTDLTTSSYVEILVDPEGKMETPWPVPETGSRFELWVMRWGTVRATLVSCWSSFKQIPTTIHPNQEGRTPSQLITRLSGTGGESLIAGAPYRLSWSTGAEIQGDFGLQKWSEDVSGEALDVSEFIRVDRSGNRLHVPSNHCRSESYALWWRGNPAGKWVLLSQFRQPIQPMPHVDFDGADCDRVSQSQSLELSGHFFPSVGGIKVIVKQSGHQTLIKEFAGKSDWDLSFCPEDFGMKTGRIELYVEYPAPWTSKSKELETWKTLRAFEATLNVTR